MIQTENNVKIEGILSEVSVRSGEFKQNGSTMVPYLSGEIKVRVTQEINKVPVEMEIPVTFFAARYTKSGKENPAYRSIQELQTNFVSIASSPNGIDGADRIRIRGAAIRENMFYGKTGNFVSYPQITASFFNKIGKSECKQEATFQNVICVANIKEEIDKNGDPTGHLILQGVVPQYGGKADLIDFRVCSADAIEHITANWSKGDTVRINGKLNFSSKTVYEEEATGFGEPIVNTRTISVSELIVTGGSASGYEGDAALDTSEVAAALSERQTRMATMKKQAEAKSNPAPKKNDFSNLGF